MRSKTLEIQAREFCIDSRRLDPNDLDVSTVSQRGSCGAAEGDDTKPAVQKAPSDLRRWEAFRKAH